MNPNTYVTKIERNSEKLISTSLNPKFCVQNWVKFPSLVYGVHKVFRSLPVVTLT